MLSVLLGLLLELGEDVVDHPHEGRVCGQVVAGREGELAVDDVVGLVDLVPGRPGAWAELPDPFPALEVESEGEGQD